MTVTYTANLNGDTFVITAETVADLDLIAEALVEGGGSLLENITTFKQLAIAKGAFTAPATSGGGGGGGSKPKSAPPPAGGRVPSCKHGEGKWAEGVNKRTRQPYSGYYCQGRFPDTCKPSKLGD